MKLYLWDWNSSSTIEQCNMEFQFLNKQDAERNDCFTSLKSAKLRAIQDIRDQIAELNDLLIHINSINVSNVKKWRIKRSG